MSSQSLHHIPADSCCNQCQVGYALAVAFSRVDWGFSLCVFLPFSGVRQASNWAECKVIHLTLLAFASSSPLHRLVCEEEREEVKEEEG